MKPHATLVTFVYGDIYRRYADALFATAAKWFFPGHPTQLLELTIPYGGARHIRDRHSYLLKNRRRVRGEFVVFLDADMLFEGPIDEEMMADGLSVPLHPAMPAGTPVDKLTYERNPDSAAYIPHGEGSRYWPGGIIGAPRSAMLDLSASIDKMCKQDGDFVPVWQDESYLNRILVDDPPALELDERYCTWFHAKVRDSRIRALDKTGAERRWKDSHPTRLQDLIPEAAC